MKQTERRVYLIEYLLAERGERIEIPNDAYNQKRLLRSLFNIRMPKETSEDFLQIQDGYLQEENRRKGITDIADLQPVQDDIYLWQGDITTLRCDAIVNAANSQMLGCFRPCHGCIDNAIHTFAGVQLRRNCNEIMQKQVHNEPTGQAKITPAYNLPCK
ncbi:MAG: macro domain-containing protein, partial [Ruminococcus sp.]